MKPKGEFTFRTTCGEVCPKWGREIKTVSPSLVGLCIDVAQKHKSPARVEFDYDELTLKQKMMTAVQLGGQARGVGQCAGPEEEFVCLNAEQVDKANEAISQIQGVVYEWRNRDR